MTEFERLLTELPSESWLAARGPGELKRLDEVLHASGRQLAQDAVLWFQRFGKQPLSDDDGPLGYFPASVESALSWREAIATVDDASAQYMSEAFVPVFSSASGNVVLVHAPLISMGKAKISWTFFKELDICRVTSMGNFVISATAVAFAMRSKLPERF